MSAALSKDEQSERTRRALIGVARDMFTEQGYAHTATEEIVRRAGVTRGALYYHYRDKAALFKAVFEEERTALIQAVLERIQAAGRALAALRCDGLPRFYRTCHKPERAAHCPYRRSGDP